jgi:tetratricopeptide (TPR) repeat protein
MSKSNTETRARARANRWLKPFLLFAGVMIAVAGVWAVFLLSEGAERRAVLERLPPRPDLSSYNEALQKAVDQAEHGLLDGELSASVGALGNLYLANNFFPEAGSCYALAMELEPENARWPHALAYVRAMMGESTGAMPLLDATVELDATYVPARLRRADARYKNANVEGAESDYRQCLELNSKNAYALLGLARIAIDRDEWDQAESMVRGALEANPKFAPAHRLLGAVHEHHGRIEERDRELDIAGIHGRYVPFPDPWLDSLEAQCLRTDMLLRKGFSLEFAGEMEQAQRIYNSILKNDPENFEATAHLAGVMFLLGDLENAAALYQRALTLTTEDLSRYAQIHTSLGRIYYAGDPVLARGNLESAVAIDPENEQAHLVLGAVLIELGEFEKSIEHSKTALTLNRMSDLAEFNWGLALLKIGNHGEAIAHLENATLLNPELTSGYYQLGQCYIQSGDRETGERYIRRALEIAQETGDRALAARIRAELG